MRWILRVRVEKRTCKAWLAYTLIYVDMCVWYCMRYFLHVFNWPSFIVRPCAKHRDSWLVCLSRACATWPWSTCRVCGKMRLRSLEASLWSPWCFTWRAGAGPRNSRSWNSPSTALGAWNRRVQLELRTMRGSMVHGIYFLSGISMPLLSLCLQNLQVCINSKWNSFQIPCLVILLITASCRWFSNASGFGISIIWVPQWVAPRIRT